MTPALENMQSLESSRGQLNDSPMIYSDPRQALVFALNMSSASPAGEVDCNPDPGPSTTVEDRLSISRNHLHLLASETCALPNLIPISPYSLPSHMCPSPDDAPPSPKIAVYSIDIDGREEPARNTPLRALDGRGPEFGPVIMVHPAFGDAVLEVGTSTPIEAGEDLFWRCRWIDCRKMVPALRDGIETHPYNWHTVSTKT